MATSTDFLQEYQQTEEAYCQGNYEQAAALVYQLVEDYPEDPSARLLCGHIYGYGLQQYDVAREQYVAFNDLQDDNFDFQDLDDADLDLSTSDLNASIGLGFNNLEDEPDYVKSNGSQSPLSFTEDNPFASGGDLEEGTEILNPLDPENSFTELEADPFTLEEDESLSVPNFATDESSTSDIEQLSGDLFSPEDELDWLDSPTENPEDESDSVHSPETLNGSSPDYLSQPTQFLEFDSFDDDELGGLNNPEAYESHPADQRELNGANHESSSPSRAVGTASSSFEAELDDIFAPLEDAADSDGSLSPDEHPPQNGFVSVKETSPFQEDEFDPDLDSAFSFSDELFVNDADDSVSLPPNTTNMKANYKVLDAEESNEEETLLTNNNAVNDSYLSDPDDSGPSRSVNGAFSSNYADAEEDEEPDDLVFDSADIPNSFDLDPDEDTFGNSFDVTVEANDTNGRSQNGKVVAQTPNDFLEDFEEFDDIGDFVITDSGDNDLYVDSDFSSVDSKFGNTTNNSTLDSDSSAIQDDEIFNTAYAASAVTTLSPDLGEAVQMTVAGILKIRETVAETSREVKRLGESSQEISKIVGLISQIASRTNLLALNASIEAARAGEAGKGFAIVADEVRQLADKSAKSLKDIEQIVMQIQSQTNTVMMAMSQGHQQVIEGTRLAEQAKRALDDIIQVTNRIDVLVRSITADTVEQNETARAVAQVMRAVEHSAQETSTEAQKVSSALTKLVGVARDLLTSVERFRVDSSEKA
ncbi:putative methyl-accepting chemotaxis protein [Planktothrix agardhii NIES-204]|nr:putative methyl-accepting chemotaxis protein [Planktothrix agardhii NIES-204]